MKYIIPCIAILFLLSSCKSNTLNPELENLNDEVMEIHDAVMPKMSNIRKLTKKIKKQLKSNADEATTAKMKTLIANLEAGNESMMSWMHQYEKPIDNSIASKSYLDDQKIKITEVRDLMESSIKDASEFLEQVKTAN